jgi:hypothetical protein
MLAADIPLVSSHSPWFGFRCHHGVRIFTNGTCCIQLAHWPTDSKVNKGACRSLSRASLQLVAGRFWATDNMLTAIGREPGNSRVIACKSYMYRSGGCARPECLQHNLQRRQRDR